MGSFAEARRRLIAKIEGCEDTHIEMLNTVLARRGVSLENYCRLNVEVGVGEFGMNEWDRLSDISTSTRRYLGKPESQKLIYDAAVKIAKIELTKRRMESHSMGRKASQTDPAKALPLPPPESAPIRNFAVELPGNDVPRRPSPSRQQRSSQQYQDDRYPFQPTINPDDKYPVTPDSAPSNFSDLPYRTSDEHSRFGGSQRTRSDELSHVGGSSPRRSGEGGYARPDAPPIPPKTPIQDAGRPMPLSPRHNGNFRLPYPDTDGPPPIVNKLKKPEFSAR